MQFVSESEVLAEIRKSHPETRGKAMVPGYYCRVPLRTHLNIAGAVLEEDLNRPNIGSIKFYPQDGSQNYVIPLERFSYNKGDVFY